MSRPRWSLAALGLCALAACSEPERPPSILLVTIDTTRADRIGCYGRVAAGTPHLDALAARGARFERAYSPAPITLPAHASLLTGTTPPRHGVRDNGSYRLQDGAVTLAELLRDRGYRTAASIGAYPLFPEYGLDQGFELYDYPRFQAPDPGTAAGERRADRVVDAALPWLERFAADEPTFLWLHFYDPHWTYDPPEPYAGEFPDDPYQGEIAFADAQLKRVLGELESLGVLEDTLVVVTSDHGEGLGEHGERTHALLTYDTSLRVPLIVAGPGVPAGTVVDEPVGLVDVLPTLAEWLDLPRPSAVEGRSLAPLLRGEAAGSSPRPIHRPIYGESWYGRLHHGWSELTTVVQRDGEQDWKLIRAPGVSGGAPELFELRTDPGELVDLATREPERVAALSQVLGELARTPEGGVDARVELDAEGAELLRGLGYAGDAPLGSAVSETTGPDGGSASLGDPRELVGTADELGELIALMAAGDLDAALPRLEALEVAAPGSLPGFELRGLYELARGEAEDDSLAFERAVEAFRAATRLQPRQEANWMRLSIALRNLNRYAEALEALRTAMTLAPVTEDMLALEHRYLEELKQRARAAESRGDGAGALELWNELVRLTPGDAAVARERERVRALTEH